MKKNNTNIIIIVVILLLLIAGGSLYFLSMNNTKSQNSDSMMLKSTESSTEKSEGSMQESSAGTANIGTESTVRSFTVNTSNYTFDIAEMRVKKGDSVTIHVKNSEGFHDFAIDQFNVKSKQLQAGEEDTLTFTADTAGEYEFYCSVGNHRQMGMVGKFIVE